MVEGPLTTAFAKQQGEEAAVPGGAQRDIMTHRRGMGLHGKRGNSAGAKRFLRQRQASSPHAL